MAYLTADDFKKYGFLPPDSGFEDAEALSERLINNVTGYYDQTMNGHDLLADLTSTTSWVARRAQQFQRAVGIQTQFLLDVGAKSNYDLTQSNLTSYSVDGTSMTFESGTIGSLTHGSTGICNETYRVLGQLGLLFAGVDHS